MTLGIYMLLFVGVINIALGLITFARNPRLTSSRYFLALTACVSGWSVGMALFYGANSVEVTLFSARVYYFSALWMNTFLLAFTIHYLNRRRFFFLIPTSIVMSSAMSLYVLFTATFFIESISLLNLGAEVMLKLGPYGVYVLLIWLYYAVNLTLFAQSVLNSSGFERARMKLMLVGFLMGGVFASYFNVYLPFFGEYSYVWLGPLFTAGFVATFTYAIVRFRLFDMRLIIARTVGYFGALIMLAIVYFVFVFLFLFNLFPDSEKTETSLLLVLSLFSLLAGMAFRTLRRRADRITQRVFYRDSYDTQKQLDKLTGVAVQEFEVDRLVERSLDIVCKSVKPASNRFIVLDAKGDYYNSYSIGSPTSFNDDSAINGLRAQRKKVLSIDGREASKLQEASSSGGSEQAAIYSYMTENGLTISVKLSTKDEIVGYLLLGPKLNGSVYTTQDDDFLSIAANEMAVAIQNARRYDEIERFNVTLKLEVEQATKDLQKTNEKLKALDQAKDEFISMASHQLRTPLTSIKGYLSMILEGDIGKVDPKQGELISAAFGSSQRMVYLISDLLNVSRLQTGKFVIEPIESYLPDVIEEEMAQLTETAKAKDITLIYKKPKRFPRVYVDETKLRQVMMNFMDNAIYYTPKGGKVEMTLKHVGMSIEFRVKDNGIGVPKEAQKNLFTKFYRADNARKARPDGTGLGLFMAKKVVIDQGGAVIFESEEGKGSTFGFMFPLERITPPGKLKSHPKKRKKVSKK